MTRCTRCGGSGLPDQEARQHALLFCPACSGAGTVAPPPLPFPRPQKRRVGTDQVRKWMLDHPGTPWTGLPRDWLVSYTRWSDLRDELRGPQDVQFPV